MNVDKTFNIARLRSPLVLLLAFLICFAAARLGSLFTVPGLEWYAGLAKPWFTPPNIAFPVAWTTLFAMMAMALWRFVRASAGRIAHNRGLIPFGLQLGLNVLWSYAFFLNRSPAAGLIVIAGLVPAIIWTMVSFGRKDRAAGWLLAPYLAWVCFAAVLNAAIWHLNA